MEVKGFIERATKIARGLEESLKIISDNQINKVEFDFNKPNVAVVVKIKNSSDKEIATIKVGNPTISPGVTSLEQTTVNIKGVQTLLVSSEINTYAESLHWCWKHYGKDKEEIKDDNR